MIASVFPWLAAKCRGVAPPDAVGAETFAPACASAFTVPARPAFAARCNGVYAPLRVVASSRAPAKINIWVSATSPLCAAQCSAVMPSPCAAFTSAPDLSRIRTDAVSPRIAASAIPSAAKGPFATLRTTIAPITRRLTIDRERHGVRAVAERAHIVHAERVHDAQHRVRHRRAVECLDVHLAVELAIRAAEQDQWAAAMVVQVRIAHRRAVHDERLVEHVAVLFLNALQAIEEVGQHADVILVDEMEVLHTLLGPAVVRRGMER